MLPSTLITISIHAPFEKVNRFLAQPENFAKWAAGLGASLRKTDGGWQADTPQGRINIVFTGENPYGVADHHIRFDNGAELHVPMRAVANGGGTDVQFTLFHLPGMTGEQLAEAKRLTDAHTEAIGALTLAELITSHSYDRHIRAGRLQNRAGRPVLRAAFWTQIRYDETL